MGEIEVDKADDLLSTHNGQDWTEPKVWNQVSHSKEWAIAAAPSADEQEAAITASYQTKALQHST